jgi:farnesyl-diphosphate farnesyltransferase
LHHRPRTTPRAARWPRCGPLPETAISTSPLLAHLLQQTSRTFALTIPFLDEPTRDEVTVAYLLFRVADTIEDATELTREEKLDQLGRFERLLAEPDVAHAERLAQRWRAAPPTAHVGYAELMRELPAIVEAALALDATAWRHIAVHTARTTHRMAAFVARTGGDGMELRDLDDLRAYCYAVAGIVGEMLTELFLHARPSLASAAADLRRDAPAFGEALQLVNILKDSLDDAGEGRHFLPASVAREAVVALARRDLDTATRYCVRLEADGAGPGIVGFTALPVLLAHATLDQVAVAGPGAKVSRAEVARIVAELGEALRAGRVATLLASPSPAV